MGAPITDTTIPIGISEPPTSTLANNPQPQKQPPPQKQKRKQPPQKRKQQKNQKEENRFQESVIRNQILKVRN